MLASGERVVTGMVQRFGSLGFVDDNAGDFGGRPFPVDGSIIAFGGFDIYVATQAVRGYPERVLVAADPPALLAARGRLVDSPASCVEVCMAVIEAERDRGRSRDVGGKAPGSSPGA